MVNPKNGDWRLGMKGFANKTGIAILDKAADIGTAVVLHAPIRSIVPKNKF
jgi:hypothetical protein